MGGVKHSLAEHVVRDVQQALSIIEQVSSSVFLLLLILLAGPQPRAERQLQPTEMLQPVTEDEKSEDPSRETAQAGEKEKKRVLKDEESKRRR